MGLLSNFFSNATRPGGPSGATGPAPAEDDVNHIRVQARRRLIGAAVLLAVGVIGFPLLFETQPRMVAGEVPAVVVRKEAAPTGKVVERQGDKPSSDKPSGDVKTAESANDKASGPPSAPGKPASTAQASAQPGLIVERANEAGREVSAGPAAAAVAAATVATAATVAANKAREQEAQRARAALEDKPKPIARAEVAKPPAPEPAKPDPKKPDAKKPDAKLEPKAEPKAEPKVTEGPGRFTVQVGAYAQDSGVKEARSKLERAGMKTYIQVLNTTEGKRTRVRTGPYLSREEAERAAQKAKGLGMTPTMVPL